MKYKMYARRFPVSVSAISISLYLTGAMQAQGAADAPQAAPAAAANVEEIVVTAERRQENVKDVPIAVTAITPKQIADLNIVTVKDIAVVTPGLTFETGYNYAQPYIRGIGTSNPNPGLEGAVATYIDGAYLERSIGEITDLFDIANVQVLKGAQGTLWGRNATGGAILYTTADPEMNQYSADVTAEYGNYNHSLGEVVANIPLADTLAIRFGVHEVSQAGYITNLSGGQDLGGKSSTTARGKIEWQPSDSFSAILSLEYYDSRDFSNVLQERSSAPFCTACLVGLGVPVAGFYQTADDRTATPYTTTSLATNLHLNYTGDLFDLSSVTSFRRDDTHVIVDEGLSTVAPFFDYHAGNGGRTFGEEFQANSKFDGMLNGMVGLSYNHDISYFEVGFHGAAFAPLEGLFSQLGVPYADPHSDQQAKTDSYSGFAELYVTPIEKLKFTFAARFTEDKRDFSATENLAAIYGVANNPTQPGAYAVNAAFYRFTPRIVADYDLDAVNLYASWNRGFKAGGFNTPSFATPNIVAPELVDNYEAGAKFISPDRRLKLNLAGFYYDYSNIQVNIVDISKGGQITTNAAKARGFGAEFDGSYKAAPWLNLFGGISYLNARYISYPNASVTVVSPTTGMLVSGTADLSGQPLPRSPDFIGSFGFNVHEPVTDNLTGNLNVVARYTSSYNFFPGAGGPLGYDRQAAYGVVNISAYIEPSDLTGTDSFGLKDYKIGFYINNATNTKYYQLRDASAGFGEYDQVAMPLTFGIRVSAGF